MSTILEALRRAERERQRGSVPSVHDPAPVLAGPMAGSSPVRAPRWFWMLALLAIVLALVVALGWWRVPREVAVASSATSTVPAPVVPAPRALAPPAAASPAAPAPAVKASEQPSGRAAAGVAPAPAPGRATRDASPPPAAPRQTPAPKAANPPEPAQATGKGPIFAPADLPAALRADLPRLHLAGITWSANAKLRMAIVNGQVLHEGESAAPGLVLERIEAARTVWVFRGYRIALASQ